MMTGEKIETENKNRPLVIAGTSSSAGKTTVACGLMGTLIGEGFEVNPFKVGPDYIDPTYHRLVTGRFSRNLDTWLTSPAHVQETFGRNSTSGLSVVEGVMGLFDGRAGTAGEGSTAEAARLIGGVVVLVADCAAVARSLAPVLAGFSSFDSGLDIGGVILNNVGSAGHARILEDAAAEAGVEVLGVLPRNTDISLKSRHLGLVPADEHGSPAEALKKIKSHVRENVDLSKILKLTGRKEGASGRVKSRPEAGSPATLNLSPVEGRLPAGNESGGVRLAVAWDEAFSFYYMDGLEALAGAGAELVYFSPLHDQGLPECDGLYLGGGFPEVFAKELEKNRSMRRSVAAAAGGGLPIYAECGGLVYLCRGLTVDGVRREMAGAVPAEARMTARRQALGYVEALARKDNLILKKGGSVRGHEFHWSQIDWPDEEAAYDCYASRRSEGKGQGYAGGNLLASYVHINFAGNAASVERFIGKCAGGKGVSASAAV